MGRKLQFLRIYPEHHRFLRVLRDEGKFESMHMALSALIATHPDPLVQTIWKESVHLTETAQTDYSTPRERRLAG